VGEPLTLIAFARIPIKITLRPGEAEEVLRARRRQTPRPSQTLCTDLPHRSSPQADGLRLSWDCLPRQAGNVTFSPTRLKTWTDTRQSRTLRGRLRIDPEPPPENKWGSGDLPEPGTYVLRAVASDGSLFTYDKVTVTVTR